MGILKWIQVLKIALSWSHTQSLLTEIFQAHWSIEGRWQKSLEINTTKESEEKIKINLGCIIEILKPRGSVPFFSASKSPQAWRGSFSLGGRRFPSPLCRQSRGSWEASMYRTMAWAKSQKQRPAPSYRGGAKPTRRHRRGCWSWQKCGQGEGKRQQLLIDPRCGHGGKGRPRQRNRKGIFFPQQIVSAMAKGRGQAAKHSWVWVQHGKCFWS